MLDTEEVVMGIIVNAYHSRSLCYEALNYAKSGDFDHASKLLEILPKWVKKRMPYRLS